MYVFSYSLLSRSLPSLVHSVAPVGAVVSCLIEIEFTLCGLFVCLFRFSDIASVSASRSNTLQITLRSAGPPIQFYTQRAALIRDLLHRFANEAEKVNNVFFI